MECLNCKGIRFVLLSLSELTLRALVIDPPQITFRGNQSHLLCGAPYNLIHLGIDQQFYFGISHWRLLLY